MTPSQRAERVIRDSERKHKAFIDKAKRDICAAIRREGQMTTSEIVLACRFPNYRGAMRVLAQMYRDRQVARRESGEWVLTGR